MEPVAWPTDASRGVTGLETHRVEWGISGHCDIGGSQRRLLLARSPGFLESISVLEVPAYPVSLERLKSEGSQ